MPLSFPCLIVSCQARPDNPLHGPHFMQAMALAAIQGGAQGIRANGPEDIAAIRAITPLPIIGLHKKDLTDYPVYITPDLEAIHEVANAGADIIAIDATQRQRPIRLEKLFASAHRLGKKVMADCSTVEEGIHAAELGADFVGTTMSGYTRYSPRLKGPDFKMLQALAQSLKIPVIGEGRFWTSSQVAKGFALGASAIVVGTAITNPREITKGFVGAVP